MWRTNSARSLNTAWCVEQEIHYNTTLCLYYNDQDTNPLLFSAMKYFNLLKLTKTQLKQHL